MPVGVDAEQIAAFTRSVMASAPFLILLARTPQPSRGEHVLGSPTRRAILDLVDEDPGRTLGEIRSRLAIGWGNCYHHVFKLERAGLVKTSRIGRRLLILPAGPDPDNAIARARAMLMGTTARSVCDDIAAHPGTEVSDITRRTSLSKRAVYYHVRQLQACGLVVSRSPTRQFALHVTSLFERAHRPG